MLIFLVQAEKKVQLQCRTNIDLRISLALVAFLPSIRGTWGPPLDPPLDYGPVKPRVSKSSSLA